MNDNEFYIKVWKYLTIATCVVIISGMASCQSGNYQITRAIEAGATPLQAACAFQMGSSSSGDMLCTIEILGGDTL